MTAFTTFVAVLAAAYFAFKQLTAMQDKLRQSQKQLEQSEGQLRQNADINRKIFRQSTWDRLISSASHINDYIANHKDNIVKPYTEKKSDQETFVLLFHHMNLAYIYHVNRDFFDDKEWDE